MQETRQIRSISLDGSVNNLTWDFIESEAKKFGFNDTSKFTQYCYEKIIHNKRIEFRSIIEIITLCLITISFLLLLVLFMR
jgi:hypothetical protein